MRLGTRVQLKIVMSVLPHISADLAAGVFPAEVVLVLSDLHTILGETRTAICLSDIIPS